MLEFTINFSGMDLTDGREALSLKPMDMTIKCDQQDLIAMKREDQTIQNITGMFLARFFEELTSTKKVVEPKPTESPYPTTENFTEVPTDTEQKAEFNLYGRWKEITSKLPKEFKKKSMTKYEAEIDVKADDEDENDEIKYTFSLELSHRIYLTISNNLNFHSVAASLYDDGELKIHGIPKEAYEEYIDDLNIPEEYKNICKFFAVGEKPAQ